MSKLSSILKLACLCAIVTIPFYLLIDAPICLGLNPPLEKGKLGLWTDHDILDEDLKLFGWALTENLWSVDSNFVNRAHGLGVKVAALTDINRFSVNELHQQLREAIERGIDIIYFDHFFQATPEAVNEHFSYGKRLKPDLICGIGELLLTDGNIDEYRKYLVGGQVDMLLTMAYIDIESNYYSIDLLADLKREFGIPYALAWVNIADKDAGNYDWLNNGMPTSNYALDHVDGVAFWVYHRFGCPFAGDYECVCNFDNVRNWILGIEEYKECPLPEVSTSLTINAPSTLNRGQTFTVSGYLTGLYKPNTILLRGGVENAPLKLTTDWGYSAEIRTGTEGKYLFSLTAPNEGGKYTITVSFEGATHFGDSSVSVTIEVTTKLKTTITVSAYFKYEYFYGYLYVNGRLRDINGNPLMYKEIIIKVSSPSGALKVQSTVVTDYYGNYTKKFFVYGWARGTYRITAQFMGDSIYEGCLAETTATL